MNVVVCTHLTNLDPSGVDLSFLPDQEISFIERCRAAAEKKRRIAGRLLLKKALSRFFDINDVPLKRDHHDRPFLDLLDAPDFNISHSGEIVIGSFTTTGKTGIDVEQTARLSLRLIDRYLHDQEKKELAALPEGLHQKRLADIWTCKEAYSKALGMGMRLPFSKIAFRFNKNNVPELTDCAPDDNIKWTFTPLTGEKYRAVVCFPKTVPPDFYTLSWSGPDDEPNNGWTEGVHLP